MYSRVDQQPNSTEHNIHNNNNIKEAEEEVHHDLTHHTLNVVRSTDNEEQQQQQQQHDIENEHFHHTPPPKNNNNNGGVIRGIQNKFTTAVSKVPFRRLSQYEEIDTTLKDDDEDENLGRFYHSYHGTGGTGDNSVMMHHSSYKDRGNESHRSVTPSTLDGTTTLGSSSANTGTTKTGVVSHEDDDDEDGKACGALQNSELLPHDPSDHDEDDEMQNHDDSLHIDFDSDMEDDEDGLQRYAFDFSASASSSANHHHHHHSPMAIPQSSFTDSFHNERVRTLSTASSDHDPRTPLTNTYNKSSFSSSLQSSSSHHDGHPYDDNNPHHHDRHHRHQHSFSSVHSSFSSHHSSTTTHNPNHHHHHAPPQSPLIKLATSIRQARTQSKRRRAERILLALSDVEVQTPLALAITHTKLCCSSWCDLFDRGYVLVIILVVVLVGVYAVLDEEIYGGTPRRVLVGVGLPVLVVRVFWGKIYWLVWGRRVEKRRQERMQLYDGLNGAHGTGGIEIPSIMGLNSSSSSNHDGGYSDQIPPNNSGGNDEGGQDGFENEDHVAVVVGVEGRKPYSDQVITMDHHDDEEMDDVDIHHGINDSSNPGDEDVDGMLGAQMYSDELIMNPLPFDACNDEHHHDQGEEHDESSDSDIHHDDDDDVENERNEGFEDGRSNDVGSNLPCPV